MTELGNRLREKRNELNISLDDLQDMTKIQKRYLQAIEEGRYDILPGKFYARAFIRQYAEAIGLDPQSLFEEFQAELPNVSDEAPVSERLSRVKTKEAAVNTVSSRIFAILPKLLVFLFIVGAAVTIWFFRQDGDKNEADIENEQSVVGETVVESEINRSVVNDAPLVEEPEKEELPVQQEETEIEENVANSAQILEIIEERTTGSTPYTTYRLLNADTFLVNVTAKDEGRSYVDIKNGKGKSFFAGEISDGESKQFDFTNEKEIEFNIGHTPSITIFVNDEELAFQLSTDHQKYKIIVDEQ